MKHAPTGAIAHQPLALVNARLIDPVRETEERGGVLIIDGIIRDLGPQVVAASLPPHAHIIDCAGDVVAPGLIDMCAFVGEPGAEHRETIATATAAGAAGGVTTILARPDTNPPIDEPAVVDFLQRRARDTGIVRVLPMAALTRGLHGEEIAEIGLLKEAGAVAFSDGPQSLRNARVMRRVMAYAKDFDALIVHFAQDPDLATDGVMNEGELGDAAGPAGRPARGRSDHARPRHPPRRAHRGALSRGACFDDSLARRHSRCKGRGPADHLRHVDQSSRPERKRYRRYRTFLKLTPPLRREDERQALVQALAEGLIDVVVSDHNPQDVETKRLPFAEAEPGAIGLETMLSAGLRLVHAGEIGLPRLLASMSSRPAEILGLPQGRLEIGAPADLIRFDPEEPYVLDPATLHSRCKNTPFDEVRMQGRVKLTIVAGELVWREG